MTMLQAFVQVVSVALVLCKEHTILNRMVKAAQLRLGGFFIKKNCFWGDVLKPHDEILEQLWNAQNRLKIMTSRTLFLCT